MKLSIKLLSVCTVFLCTMSGCAQNSNNFELISTHFKIEGYKGGEKDNSKEYINTTFSIKKSGDSLTLLLLFGDGTYKRKVHEIDKIEFPHDKRYSFSGGERSQDFTINNVKRVMKLINAFDTKTYYVVIEKYDGEFIYCFCWPNYKNNLDMPLVIYYGNYTK